MEYKNLSKVEKINIVARRKGIVLTDFEINRISEEVLERKSLEPNITDVEGNEIGSIIDRIVRER